MARLSKSYQKAFVSHIASFGFETHDSDAVEVWEGASAKWLKNHLSSSPKMEGGRYALPGEYFALKSSNLTDDMGDNLTQLTDQYVRPGVPETFFEMPRCGGGIQSTSTLFEHALKLYRADNKGLRLKSDTKKLFQQKFDEFATDTINAVRKIAPKTKHLKASALTKAIKKVTNKKV